MASRLLETICSKAKNAQRFMVAIAGPPSSGKSTLAEQLAEQLREAGESAVVVPMDGFHYDDLLLNKRGHRARKGASFTFDVAGFLHLLKRIKAREDEIAIPVFDRKIEIARAGADVISASTKYIIIEGNYLLLEEQPWQALKPIFDYTCFLEVAEAELEQRLMKRWRDLGFDERYAKNWIASNDLLNIRHVKSASGTADFTLTQ